MTVHVEAVFLCCDYLKKHSDELHAERPSMQILADRITTEIKMRVGVNTLKVCMKREKMHWRAKIHRTSKDSPKEAELTRILNLLAFQCFEIRKEIGMEMDKELAILHTVLERRVEELKNGEEE